MVFHSLVTSLKGQSSHSLASSWQSVNLNGLTLVNDNERKEGSERNCIEASAAIANRSVRSQRANVEVAGSQKQRTNTANGEFERRQRTQQQLSRQQQRPCCAGHSRVRVRDCLASTREAPCACVCASVASCGRSNKCRRPIRFRRIQADNRQTDRLSCFASLCFLLFSSRFCTLLFCVAANHNVASFVLIIAFTSSSSSAS